MATSTTPPPRNSTGSSFDHRLRELVRIRASQLNGCAYCIDMHTKDARAVGETEQRLYALPAWRETPFFTARERAALAFTESVTLVAADHVPAAAYEAVAAQFSAGRGRRAGQPDRRRSTPGTRSASATRAWVPGPTSREPAHRGSPAVPRGPSRLAAAGAAERLGRRERPCVRRCGVQRTGHLERRPSPMPWVMPMASGTPAAEMFAAITRITRSVGCTGDRGHRGGVRAGPR